MRTEDFVRALGAEFYTGVPDSRLKPLCNWLLDNYGTDPRRHIIAANEGNCAAIAAGYYLATGKIPAVYLQNSGEGNIINPLASLMNRAVYGIPCVFIIGWRGEPGIKDEPQHLFQGQITLKLLETMEIPYFIVDEKTTAGELNTAMEAFRPKLAEGGQTALVIRGNALSCDSEAKYTNGAVLKREEAISLITEAAADGLIVSTTGKASRELFEIRESKGRDHSRDFLTVGGMGHCSSIALGIALQSPEKRVWCLDGDGAALMHLGSIAVIGASKPDNLVHIVLNNAAHESVGGMPTAAGTADLTAIAKACGYKYASRADSAESLILELKSRKDAKALSFLEVKCAIGSRPNLGRPTTTPEENKREFMSRLSEG